MRRAETAALLRAAHCELLRLERVQEMRAIARATRARSDVAEAPGGNVVLMAVDAGGNVVEGDNVVVEGGNVVVEGDACGNVGNSVATELDIWVATELDDDNESDTYVVHTLCPTLKRISLIDGVARSFEE